MQTLWLDGVGHAGFLLRRSALARITAAIAGVCAAPAGGEATSSGPDIPPIAARDDAADERGALGEEGAGLRAAAAPGQPRSRRGGGGGGAAGGGGRVRRSSAAAAAAAGL